MILEKLNLDKALYRVGLTKVFFRAGVLAELEDQRDDSSGISWSVFSPQLGDSFNAELPTNVSIEQKQPASYSGTFRCILTSSRIPGGGFLLV